MGSVFPCATPPNLVLMAPHSSGGRGEWNETLRAKLSAVNTEAVRAGHTASAPIETAQKNTPHQPVPGKRMPAAVNGDAQPMIPSGGHTVRTMPTGARQIASRRRGDHTSSHGKASNREAETQSPMETRADTSGPKKFLAPGIRGHRAAA